MACRRREGERARRLAEAAPPGRLTFADRLALHGWRGRAAVCGYTRIELCGDADDDGVAGDYLAVYRDAMWAAWCAARHGAVVRVWRCATGADLGEFPTMDAALAAILAQG